MSFDQCRSFYCDCPSTRMGDFAWVDTQGLLHRTDGAAVVDGNTGWRWLRHGDRHRLDGPAIVYEREEHGWWLEGRKVTAHDVVAAWLSMHHPGTSPQVLETLARVCKWWEEEVDTMAELYVAVSAALA
ncbi:hypothetical protein [Janibacter sp. DB-40]|uniref:hypothetical protein n=1 Tax=Janibacter sp. DB-40 TaxID=3028808 RepID=UPI00240526AE|nr:hypothetical protein [Janibacter sp. DB-40]